MRIRNRWLRAGAYSLGTALVATVVLLTGPLLKVPGEMTLVILVFGQHWLLIPLAYGFVARVATGPTLSPLGQLVTRGVTPRLGVAGKPVPGPPKRFAQGIGATLTVSALILYFGFGATTAADVLVAMVLAAATLESVFAYCVGCKLFAILMRTGIIPEDVCEECNNI